MLNLMTDILQICRLDYLSIKIPRHLRWYVLYFKKLVSLVCGACRYSSDTSPIGALSILPPVSWRCWFNRSPSWLADATVSYSPVQTDRYVYGFIGARNQNFTMFFWGKFIFRCSCMPCSNLLRQPF